MQQMPLIVAFCALISMFQTPATLPQDSSVTTQPVTDVQRFAEQMPWSWHEERANALYCLTQVRPPYRVELVQRDAKAAPWGLTIRILQDNTLKHEFRGHTGTVFSFWQDTVYIANFGPISSGCEIVAVDLNEGKELWRTHLKGLGSVDHSLYSNKVNMVVQNAKHIHVFGQEAAGLYFEVLDQLRGETVGHRRYTAEETDPRMPELRKVIDWMFRACESGDVRFLEQALDAGLSPTLPNGVGKTLLHAAVGARQPKVVHFLIGRGMDVNAPDAGGEPPIMHACRAYEQRPLTPVAIDIARMLLEAGASPEGKADGGFSPLYWAADAGSTTLAEILLKHGAKVDGNVGGNPPILAAISRDNAEMIGQLARHGANVNQRLYTEETLLQIATRRNLQKAKKALEDLGAQ